MLEQELKIAPMPPETFLRDIREASALETVKKGRYVPIEKLRRRIEETLR